MRIAVFVALLSALAAAQDRAAIDGARRSVVGVQAQRSINVRGHPLLTAGRQVGIVVAREDGATLVLTPSLGADPRNVSVFTRGATEPLEAEVLDGDAAFSLLKVQGELESAVTFVDDWEPAEGRKLVWVGLLVGSIGRWTPVHREGSVDALLEDPTSEEELVFSDPPFSGAVMSLGALVLDGAGRPVGVVVRKAPPADMGAGGARRRARMGGGLPIVVGTSAFAHLLGGGGARRGFLGVSVEALTEKLAGALGIEGTRGVVVTQVTPGSGAEKAGLRAQDVLVSVGGEEVASPVALQGALRGHAPESSVEIQFIRLGERGAESKTCEATLTERESAADRERFRAPRLGLVAVPLTASLRRTEGLDAEVQGVYVRRVIQGSPASLGRPTGLARGDVVLRVGQRPVPDLETFKAALAAVPSGESVTLFVRRGTETRFVEVVPEEDGD
jgi:serine protease Do